VDYSELVLGAHIAWFQLLDRAGCASRRIPGALAVKTGVGSNTDNGVAVDPDSVDLRELEAVVSWLRYDGPPASCVLVKPATPPMLERLGSLGLVADNTGNEMGRSLGSYRPTRATGDYAIVEAVTEAEILQGLVALGDDWYDDEDRQRRLRIDMTIGIGPASPVRHWVAYHQGNAIAMATSFRYDRTVVLVHCGVDPAHRRRGVATALTSARLAAAISSGATTAVLSPSPDGYELHSRLGFDRVATHPDRWFHIR
jgi:hypothetical protein